MDDMEKRMMQHLPTLTNLLLGSSREYPNGLSMSEVTEEDGFLCWDVWDEYDGAETETCFREPKETVLALLKAVEEDCPTCDQICRIRS